MSPILFSIVSNFAPIEIEIDLIKQWQILSMHARVQICSWNISSLISACLLGYKTSNTEQYGLYS